MSLSLSLSEAASNRSVCLCLCLFDVLLRWKVLQAVWEVFVCRQKIERQSGGARKTWQMMALIIVMVIMMMMVMMNTMVIVMVIMMMMAIIKGKIWKDNWERPRRACLRQTEKVKVLQQGSELFMQSWRR